MVTEKNQGSNTLCEAYNNKKSRVSWDSLDISENLFMIMSDWYVHYLSYLRRMYHSGSEQKRKQLLIN